MASEYNLLLNTSVYNILLNIPEYNIISRYFVPDDIPGLFIHYRADKSLVNGDRVLQLNDLTINRIHASQPTPLEQPRYLEEDSDFNRTPSVYFDGNAEHIDDLRTEYFKHDLPQPNTIAIIFKDQSNDAGVHFDGLIEGKQHLYADIFGVRIIEAGNALVGLPPDTERDIGVFRFNTTQTTGYLNGGAPIFEGDVGNQPLNGLVFGTNLNIDNHKDYKMAEFLLWDRLLTDEEVNRLGSYLNEVYNIPWTDI